MPWLLLLALAAWITYDGDGDPVTGLMDTLARITRGSRLTRAPYDPQTGVVPGTPEDLATEAGGLTADQYALARLISSEEGTSDNTIKTAVALATVNHAAAVGKTVTELLTHAVEPNHSGRFGTYHNIDPSSSHYTTNAKGTPNAPDRYASTALDPYDGDGQIAAQVLDGTIADFTNGAQYYDRPGGEKDPGYTEKKRLAAGLSQVYPEGIDPTEIRFWA
jgi:hypothetical protein